MSNTGNPKRSKKSISILPEQEEFLKRIAPPDSRMGSSCVQSALDLLMEASERYGRPFNSAMLSRDTEDFRIISMDDLSRLEAAAKAGEKKR